MPSIEILKTGRLDERDSAYPQAVQLPGGDILCSFSVGGGPNVHGGTDFARSTDGGETWQVEGTILPPGSDPVSTNFLKLSVSPDGSTIYAYGARLYRKLGAKLGEGRRVPVLCISSDGGRSWSDAHELPTPTAWPLEISHGILPLSSGRLLAPSATLPDKSRLGEQVLVAVSDDGGKTWPDHSIVFEDPQKKLGYFEHKLAELSPGRVMATAWTVTLGDIQDRPNSFCISNDYGSTWGPARSTDINGQTLTPIPLDGNNLLVLYNRRYGKQAIAMRLVTFDDENWTTHYEGILYDPCSIRDRDENTQKGLDELDSFAFGFPTAIRLMDGTILATFWSKEKETFGISWAKLRVL